MHIKMPLLGAVATALACVVASSVAAVLPEKIQANIERKTKSFVQAPGYRPVDADQLIDDDWYSARRFVNQSPSSIRNPDADLDPVTKAVLLLESREPPLESARYHIAYQLLAMDSDAPEIQHAMVQVTRFNLTGARHRDVVESYGEHAGPAGKETAYPHVSWRFISSANQGQRADIVAASRRVLDDSQAAKSRCLGTPCVTLNSTLGMQPPFTSWQPDSTAPPAVYQARWPAQLQGDGAIAVPARVAEELFYLATEHGEEASMHGDFSRPQMTFVISFNDGAQDSAISGVLRQAELADDDVAQVWISRNQTAGGVEWYRHIVRWPHRQ